MTADQRPGMLRAIPNQEPREMVPMDLPGITLALIRGNRLHGFLSGSGLRVIRIEGEGDRLTGYGEHPHVTDALLHASEDYLTGRRNYKYVYGKKYPHYLTGSSESTSDLDSWLLQGNTIDAYKRPDGETVVELTGLTLVHIPNDVSDRVRISHKSVTWRQRGFTYVTKPTYINLYNGKVDGESTTVIKSPDDGSLTDPWSYYSSKIGEGQDFNEALNKAFEAPNLEILGRHHLYT